MKGVEVFIGFSKKTVLLRHFVAVFNDQLEHGEKPISEKKATQNAGFLYWLDVWQDDPLRAKLLSLLR